MNVSQRKPPALVIEIFLDTVELTQNQSLVIVDDNGKRHGVADGLRASSPSDIEYSLQGAKSGKIILERWTIEVGGSVAAEDMNDALPNVYKKAVVLFRSLYTTARLLPSWKLYKRTAKQTAHHPVLEPRYRVISSASRPPRSDNLKVPLFEHSEPVTEEYRFRPSSSPVGPLCINVLYRINCEFRIDDSEEILSSQFMGLEEAYFKPSLSRGNAAGAIPGSLPVRSNQTVDPSGGSQAYGSLSTFHQIVPQPGTSPISALRAARDRSSPSPTDSSLQKILPQRNPSRTRPGDGHAIRRTSISFQPFKAGSLASSPATGRSIPTSPGTSLGRAPEMTPLSHARSRSSLNALPQANLRQPSSVSEVAGLSSNPSSPRPAPTSRYSSSFGNRSKRYSSGGTPKAEDDNNSSGRGSLNSSAQKGSLTEADGGSSGSVQADEDNISDFLNLLEQKKDLKSFQRTDSTAKSVSMKRTTAALSKYQRMRESNAVLSESLSSSLVLNRSSSSSSRQLSSIPPMVAGTSVSSSSSPGKPLSPHTPHTPAVPSRLSIIDNSHQPRRSHVRARTSSNQEPPEPQGNALREATVQDRIPNAIDIPSSPRSWSRMRRPSSVSSRLPIVEDDHDAYGMRSASFPTDERPESSLSELLHMHDTPMPHGQPNEASARTIQSALRASGTATAHATSANQSREARNQVAGPAESHNAMAQSRSRRSGGVSDRAGRYAISHRSPNTEDDGGEPLLFTMSELQYGSSSRRNT